MFASWELTVLYVYERPCTLNFDLLPGSSPPMIGLDVAKDVVQNNVANPQYLLIRRSIETASRTFHTYIASNPGSLSNSRIRVEIIARPKSCMTSLLGTRISKQARRVPKRFAKRIHRLTHAPKEQIKSICKHAGILHPQLEEAIDAVDTACDMCSSSDRSAASVKISLSHMNEAFNQGVQLEFAFECIKGEVRTIFVLTDVGTGYTEGAIAPKRDLVTIVILLEHLWILRHGVSADDEYNKSHVTTFLLMHNVLFKP